MKKIKCILIGENRVGKTHLINQYVNNQFEEDYLQTIGDDRTIKELTINGKKIILELWDTIGKKQLRAANKIFMKKTNIALIVYDITYKKSFDNLNEFYKELIQHSKKDNMIIGVIANKSDLYEDSVINREEGEEFAGKINAFFFETSATDHENVENVFNQLINAYIDKFESSEKQIDNNTNKIIIENNSEIQKKNENSNTYKHNITLEKEKVEDNQNELDYEDGIYKSRCSII